MSKRRPSYIHPDEWIENLNECVLQLAHEYLPLDDFGFRVSHKDEYHTVILDSEWCRVRFFADWESDYPGQSIEYYLRISYGRLHAPNDGRLMEWSGEICKPWIILPFFYTLEFLKDFFRLQNPEIHFASFIQSSKKNKLKSLDNIRQRLAFESEIWKHYVPELFYLFDLRRPELWEQYCAWLKARYVAEGRKEEDDERKGLIPYYRVC
jgi:hypothetical protein